MINEEMVKKLHEKIVADGLTFPAHVTLEVAGETVEGFIYEDGHFGEGEVEPKVAAATDDTEEEDDDEDAEGEA